MTSGGAADEVFQVTKIELSDAGEPMGVADPLDVAVYFTAVQPVPDAVWTVQYVVDTAATRHVIELGASERQSYAAGECQFAYHVESIDVQGIKKHVLRNVGMLVLTLSSGNEELLDIKLITQVSKASAGGGALERLIMNPLE